MEETKQINMHNSIELTSERLILRPIEVKDLQELHLLSNDPEVMKFVNGPDQDMAATEVRLNRYLSYMSRNPGLGVFRVQLKDSAEAIGLGFLVHIEMKDENQKIEVGYRLDKKFWGQGYATEIGSCLMDYGFSKLKLNEVYATTHPDNIVSQKVLLKMGMKNLGDIDFYGGSKFFVKVQG